MSPRTRSSVLLVSLAIAVLSACGSEPEPSVWFPVEIHAAAGATPVPGTRISVAGRILGDTDAQGVLATVLEGREGTRIALQARCPEGYGQPEGPVPLVLRRIARPGHPDELRSVSVVVECRVAMRDVVVVISTHGVPAVPVQVDGRTLATTDALGLAHVALRAAPGSSMRVQLDTSALADVLPRSPALTFHVPDHDEVVTFDRPLERVVAPPPPPHCDRRCRERRARGRDRPVPVPIRIRRTPT